MASQVSALKLFDLTQSHRVTAIIYVAVEAGLPSCCGTGRSRLVNSQGQPARMNGRLGVC